MVFGLRTIPRVMNWGFGLRPIIIVWMKAESSAGSGRHLERAYLYGSLFSFDNHRMATRLWRAKLDVAPQERRAQSATARRRRLMIDWSTLPPREFLDARYVSSIKPKSRVGPPL